MNIVSVEELKKLKYDKDLFLLDVRENEEVESNPMLDMPYNHIPMNEVPSRLDEIDPNKKIVVFCHLGGRSAKVCDLLINNGYKNVYNLTGGITAWLGK